MASRDDDDELIRESLRRVLRAEGTSAKLLAAQAQAARQLAAMDGLIKVGKEEPDDGVPPDPFADLDDMERERQKRARKNVGTLIRRIA